jgi:hypothetical protein
MNERSGESEVVIGPEFDAELLGRLRRVVEAARGSISESSYGVGGSQEVITYEILLPSGMLVATAETYIGLSIRGPAALVEEVRLAVQQA